MSALREFASAAANTIYAALAAAETPDKLDQLARVLWQGYGEGAISEADAQALGEMISNRRPRRGHAAANPVKVRVGRFASRQRPRSPDRKVSRDRRRLLGGSSALPPNLRHHYTEGQRAVLCIVAGEVKIHGACDLPIEKIAALAGVCRTTVQTTMHEARRLGHVAITERPRPGRKSLPNVVEIISREWRVWLRRGPSGHGRIGSNPLEMVSATKSRSYQTRSAMQADRPQEAFRGVQGARPKPPDQGSERRYGT